MAREKIELVIDVVTSSAKSALGRFKDDIDEADGAFGKLKAGAKSAFDNLGGVITAGLAAAGTAIVGFGTKAVTEFQDVALESGKLAESLGVSAEEASRLIEVAGDLGIETGTLESAMGRMNKTIASSPDKFDAIGAAIARNKDGTVDVVQTFKNAAQAIDQIPDAAVRAKAAQDIFGRGWQQIAELISGGAKGISDAMASVEKGKVIDDKEVARARAFRDTMDALKGKFEEFAISAGGHIVRMINGFDDLGRAADEAFRWVTARDARRLIYDNVIDPIKAAGEQMEATFNQGASVALAALKTALSPATVATQALVDRTVQLGLTLRAAADAGKEQFGPGIERITDASKAFAEAQRDIADALNESIDAMFESADASVAAEDAQKDFAKAVQNTVDVMDDADASASDVADAVDRERDAMRRAAEAAVNLAEKQATANGRTLTATERVDKFNESLLSNAAYATPAARKAISDYIIEANNVPGSKATFLEALIVQGRFDEAARLLAEVSAPRQAAITADANTRNAEDALNYTARDRSARINAAVQLSGTQRLPTILGGQALFADGGRVGPAGGIGGEAGAELVELNGRQAIIDSPTSLPPGAMVTPLGEGGAASYALGGASSGGPTYVTVNMPPGTSIDEALRTMARKAKYNGPAHARRLAAGRWVS